MAGCEIQSLIFVSHQPAMQNIYFTERTTKTKLNFLRKRWSFCTKKIM